MKHFDAFRRFLYIELLNGITHIWWVPQQQKLVVFSLCRTGFTLLNQPKDEMQDPGNWIFAFILLANTTVLSFCTVIVFRTTSHVRRNHTNCGKGAHVQIQVLACQSMTKYAAVEQMERGARSCTHSNRCFGQIPCRLNRHSLLPIPVPFLNKDLFSKHFLF